MKGKVVYSDTGEPVSAGIVFLESGNYLSRAPIQKDGTFAVGSWKKGDGLPKGQYKVYIVGAKDSVSGGVPDKRHKPNKNKIPQAAPMAVVQLIDMKYEQPATSGLELTVDGSTKECVFKVDRYQSKTRKK